MKRSWLGLAVVMLSGFSLQAQALESQPVQRAPLTESIQLDGVIEAVRQATVSAQTSGQVRRIHFDVDDAVAPGQVIVELNDTEQRARLNQAEAGLREAEAGLNDARQNFSRVEGLVQRELAPRAQLDQARNQLNAAEARLSRAQAAVAEARQQLAYTRVIAPYGGIVTARHVEEGASVNPGQPLISGLSLEELRVVVALPQRYAASARQQREAQVMLMDGRVLETDGMTFYPYADPATHTFRVRMNLKNPEGDLFPGMLVKVSLPVAERSALWIPSAALVQRGELRAVYVLNAEGQPRLRQVRVGSRANGQIEVLSGLGEGELLVLNPAAALARLEAE
ncbi:efflux RND transporter periplasmic adaptor subunit [Marinospirillum alkaliphilum]|uniref:RND family efflux transporter, MFP subunit n=1 Tax=Marinospirillum alkaliphilum DSM 21637 TaxID=1122209 RepID=A0A1K1V973_9GAMM|nr:efflux RND transporter periplasmic adaptor subunit [Marinospirillum alkaliphilum]SFX21698.1 RND family efflux transporter, MFP subunit [Marinospirillum alkaliphilum DSM 21637]